MAKAPSQSSFTTDMRSHFIKDVDGDRIWKNLRRFCGWMFLGGVMGVLTFSVLLSWQDTISIQAGRNLSQKENYRSRAVSERYLAASFVFYPMLTLCVIYCMNTLLQRVSDHASHPYYNTFATENMLKTTASSDSIAGTALASTLCTTGCEPCT